MKLMGALCGLGCVWLAVACSGGTSKNDASASGGDSATGGSQGQSGSAAAGQHSSGATSGGTSSVGPNAPLSDYPRSYAAATCRLLQRCYNATFVALDVCTDALEVALGEQVLTQVDEAVKDGRVVYAPKGLPACLDAVANASCDEVLFDECRSVFVGTKKTGESCLIDLECADQQQCAVNGMCPGTCAPAGKANEACSTYNRCALGLTCNDDVCVKAAKLGEACSTTIRCQGYGFCSGLDIATPEDTGTCVARGEVATSGQDEPCESFSEPLCKPGFVCTTRLEGDIVVGSCQKPVASGAACTYSTPDACPEAEYCHITSALGVKPATGTCTIQPKIGEACRFEDAHLATCEDGSHCDLDSKLCVVTSHLDEPCMDDAGCYSNTCVDGKCVPRVECEESERALLPL